MFNKKYGRRLLTVLMLPILSFAWSANAQTKDTAKNKKADTAAIKVPAVKPDAPKPYKDVITAQARTYNGFFKVHKIDDRCFFEIPDSLLGRDLLTVNRISKSAAEFRNAFFRLASYAGDWVGESVIRFDKGPGTKLLLRMVSYKERSNDSSENGLYKSIANNNIQPIYASFPVKAYNKEKNSTVIDLTDFINSDNPVFGYLSALKPYSSLNAMAADRSYIDSVLAFPVNIEIKSVKTYTRTAPSNPVPVPFTFEFNNSIVLLPKVPMKGRKHDPRVGYFGLLPTDYIDYDANPVGAQLTSNIWRWRLEPKPEDVEKYNRGELVEPQKPIVIYIDPLTPKKWIPYLIAGVNDWKVAFEKAGFKNAIIGKEAPVNDSTWSIDDARHSALVYKPSDYPNASGPSVKDPRSGEILETHINWYHSVMSLLYRWYFIQAGAIDPRANQPQLPDSLMGQLIRFVSSHEIGHTLGLRHNWGASSTVPVEKLRDKAWVEAHGHTPSIMDYARFNYVAQPEDHISEKGIFPRIGDYDKWAIEWGYRIIPGNKTREEEAVILNKWIIEKLRSGKQYYFGIEATGDDPFSTVDPRNQNEDLGDDAVLASTYGIKNLKRIMPNLMKWTQEPDKNYNKAAELYTELVNQFQRYMGHVSKSIGGVYSTPKTVEEQGPVYAFVPKEKQKRAMKFLQEELFTTPTWLIDKKLYSVSSASIGSISNAQRTILLQLLDSKTLYRLVAQEAQDGAKAYTAAEMLQDLKQGVFAEIYSHAAISLNRRDLQKAYVTKLILLMQKDISAESDASSVIKAHAKDLRNALKAAAITAPDNASRMHLADLQDRLDIALKPRS